MFASLAVSREERSAVVALARPTLAPSPRPSLPSPDTGTSQAMPAHELDTAQSFPGAFHTAISPRNHAIRGRTAYSGSRRSQMGYGGRVNEATPGGRAEEPPPSPTVIVLCSLSHDPWPD